MIIRNQRLDPHKLKALEELIEDSRKFDQFSQPFYLPLLKEVRSMGENFFYSKQGEIQGFAASYYFYEDACEIAILVRPSCRGRGIAQTLLMELLVKLRENNIKELYFSCLESSKPWLLDLGFLFQQSEYQMHWKKAALAPIQKPELGIRPAEENDIPSIYAIDQICFPGQKTELIMHLHSIFKKPNYKIFIASIQDEVIAKAQLAFQDEMLELSDIAVLPTYQGKGYGTALLAHCIEYAQSKGQKNISLTVETKNEAALDLYTKLGFEIQNQWSYCSISMDKLAQILF